MSDTFIRTGDTGDKDDKSRVFSRLPVPGASEDLSPLFLTGDTEPAKVGTRITLKKQDVSSDVPTVPGVPTQKQGGVHS